MSEEDINRIAWEVYEELNRKGAELGNASVFIIEKVLDRYLSDKVEGVHHEGNSE